MPFEPLAQSHVSVIHSAEGRFSVGYGALALDNATSGTVPNAVLPLGDGAPDPAACL